MKSTIVKILPFILIINLFLIFGYVIVNPKTIGIGVNKLMIIQPIFFAINFVLILIFGLFNFHNFKKQFSGIRKQTWVYLFLIILFGFCLREFVVPHTHRIFFDEDLYLGIANSIATEGINILCNYGTPTKCIEGILNKDPSGYPFFIAIFYKIFGSSQLLAYQISVMVGTISILLIFVITYLLFKNQEISLYSTLLLSLIPVHIIWSGSTATELVFLFFSLLTIISFLLYLRTDKYATLLLGITLLAYTIQIRPEGLALILLIGFMFLLFEKNLLGKLKNYRFWVPWLILFMLITPHAIQLYMNKEGDWGAPSGKKFGLEYATTNFNDNLGFWFNNEMHPVLFTIFTLVGIFYLSKTNKKILFFNAIWFLLFFTIFMFFYAGGVKNGGIGTRFVNIYCVPIIILGGYGLYEFRLLTKITNKKIISLILVSLILISFYFFIPFIQTPDKQAEYARDMHNFVMLNMDKIDNSCYVLTHNPSIFLVAGKNSLQTWFGQNKKVMDKIFSETDCVLWLEGAWCLFEPHKSGVCKNMHDNYNLTVFARYVREENPEQVFTIYNVFKKQLTSLSVP